MRKIHNVEDSRMKKSQREKEANARRKVAQHWSRLSQSCKYQIAATKEASKRMTLLLEESLFDGILLNLKERNKIKSYNVQKRVLRRIVEKRQAQSNYRVIKRTCDRFSAHLLCFNYSESMNELNRFQYCA